MGEVIRRDKKALVVSIYFLLLTVWWITLQFTGNFRQFQLDVFTISYGYVALFGGIWGLLTARKWGGFKSLIGRAVIAFSFGLLAQELGQLIYTYFIYFKGVEVPYPSWGDLGFFGSIPLYIYGTVLLAKASGIRAVIRAFSGKLQALFIPLIALAFSSYVFLQGYEVDWTNPLRVFLDFGYPIGQAIYLSIALLTYLLSYNSLGGIMRGKILFILGALFVQYIADFIFLYQASRGTCAVSCISDYIYFVAYFLMALSLLQLNRVMTQFKTGEV